MRYERHPNKRGQIAAEEENGEGSQDNKQARQGRKLEKRASEKGGDDYESSAKLQQLNDQPNYDKEMQKQNDAETGIATVQNYSGKQHLGDPSGKPFIPESVEE